MKNLVLISSVIKTSSNPLSYINTRSIYSHEERYEQTKKTIQSIKEKIPGAKIIMVECSNFRDDEIEYLQNNTDYFLNLYNDSEKKERIQSRSKSLGEGTMTFSALEFIMQNNIEYDNLIKISGRYWFSEKFNYEIFNNNDIVVKYIDDNDYNVFTALYKLPKYVIPDFKNFLENNYQKMVNCIGYENLFANFLKEHKYVNIHVVNPIGLTGHLSVSNDFFEG